MMHDEFLHRLRKDPRPEFAARLRAELRQASATPLRPRAPSRVRTLISVLLLGGTAFAVTSVAMRGLPVSLLELYQHAVVWIRAEHGNTPANQGVDQGFRRGLGWDASGWSSPHGAAPRSGFAHSAAPATSVQAAATASAGSAGGSTSGGAAGLQVSQIKAVSSWAAYPYAAAISEQMNRTTGTVGAPIWPHIDVSVRDSDLWPGPMCSGGTGAPDVSYAFEPAGTVSDRPCPQGPSGTPSPVRAFHVGYEAVVLARSPLYGELDLTRRQIFLALARWVPDPARAGTVHENASTTWRQIDAALGPEPIELMGPPLSSGGGRSMVELLMEGGCNTYPWIAALASTDPTRHARICRTVRSDRKYVEVSYLNAARLLAEPNAVGILDVRWTFTFPSLVELRPDGLAVSRLDGVDATPQDIQSGAYPGSRGFYLYVNRERVAPNFVLRLLGSALQPYPDSDWAFIPPPQPEVRAAYAEALGP